MELELTKPHFIVTIIIIAILTIVELSSAESVGKQCFIVSPISARLVGGGAGSLCFCLFQAVCTVKGRES